MNFHTDCPKGFLYDGDVNIAHGGVFLSTELIEGLMKAMKEFEPWNEWVDFWSVEEFSMMDNQWLLTAGTVLITYDACMEAKYMENHGKLPDDEKLAAEAWMMWRYRETHAKDETESKLIQIGFDTTYHSSNPAVPDHVYHAHKKLHNVALEWLKEV